MPRDPEEAAGGAHQLPREGECLHRASVELETQCPRLVMGYGAVLTQGGPPGQ